MHNPHELKVFPSQRAPLLTFSRDQRTCFGDRPVETGRAVFQRLPAISFSHDLTMRFACEVGALSNCMRS